MAGADKDVIRECFDHSRRIQASLGLSILLTALIGSVSIYYAVSIAFDEPIVAIAAALIWFLYVQNFDSQLAIASSKRAVYLRLIPALIVGIVVSVPLELRFLDGRIEKHLQEENMAENSHLFEKANAARLQYKEAQAEFKDHMTIVQNRLSENRRLRSAEASGMRIQGATGVGGFGPNWRFYQAEVAKDSTEQLRIEAGMERARKDYQNDSLYVEGLKEATFMEQSFDFLSRYEALERLKSESPAANAIAWALRLFFIMIEVSPALVKLFMPKTEFHTIIEARMTLAKEAIVLNANKDMDDLLNDPTQFPQESYWERIRNFLVMNRVKVK
jgi:hypothetical protein